MSSGTKSVKTQAINRGILSSGTNFEERYVADFDRLAEMVEAFKTVGLKIVLTQGSFDFIHIGHFQYLEKAKAAGDILIVAVDSDAKIRKRKGPDRPIVSQDERIKMLTHVRHVDVVTLKEDGLPKWELIKKIQPDVLIAIQENYTPEQIKELGDYCGEVTILERQATTSSTAKLRRLNIGLAEKMKQTISSAVEEAFDKLAKDA
jgi:D-glycero-beta-D-manno-heptose 1-phosphate adenylyltransferase